MPKENIYSVVDSPRFEPWTTENWFDKEWILHSRELFQTQIKIKQGSINSFTKILQDFSQSHEPYYFEFYSPHGSSEKAEIRGFSVPENKEVDFDTLNILVSLTPNQILTLFPLPSSNDFSGY